MMLNDQFVQDQGGRFAARLRREAGPEATAQIRRGFALAMQRAPAEAEMDAARRLLDTQRRLVKDQPEPERRALETFCVALLNLNELIYVD